MGKSYQQHFGQRGSAYDRAMLQFPAARQQEFEQVIAAAQLSPNMTVAYVPAGGGYLRPYLPAGVVYLAHEPCASFTNHGAVPGTITRERFFLDQGTLNELEHAGFIIEQCHRNDFHWSFPDRQSMAAFCHQLFDIQKSTPADTLRSIETQLGVTENTDGSVGMHWSLMTIAAVTPC
ncbi:hypothetical protein ACFOD1_02755 [Pseudidiomarina halophila]|uniref:SAM-dependent methyltransferase n=1 Tax=Pseudidiomarina halophila TaxID=1449799 RepID=A0A432XYT3_9GAMM|nr:hypothetical protein [Pseudidiomarina halophila]RUO53879.1 hypothetical protein CWI69_00090 [Pseudidiomarina halophila]